MNGARAAESHHTGAVVRNGMCALCDRQFRGPPATVSKLLKMHMKVAHGEEVSAQPDAGVVQTWNAQKDQVGARVRVNAESKQLLDEAGLDARFREV
jgi:hypothetical protein